MSSVPIALLGALSGLGVLIGWFGATHRTVLPRTTTSGRRSAKGMLHRGLAAALAGIATLVVTRWPVAAVASVSAAWCAPPTLRARGRHQREIARAEAIATWTEQLRDTLAAANGLEHALAATAGVAPAPIADAVERLGARAAYEPLPDALRRFADEVDHPLADFVVAALVTATEREARDIGPLLGHLAECARDEARLRTRVWVSRARSRSAVQIIVAVIIVFLLGLLLLNRQYLRPYDSVHGQLVLSGVLSSFAGAVLLMDRLGRLAMPERFIRRRASSVP